MTIEELKQAMQEILANKEKTLFNEMKTQLINNVLPEIKEQVNVSILSDEKNGIKSKLLEEIGKKKEQEKTYDELLAENEGYKKQLEERDLQLKSIEENKVIMNVLGTLDVVPHDADLIVNIVKNSKEFIEASNSKKGVTEDMLKEKIMSISETQGFLFKPQPQKVQGFGNPTDVIVGNGKVSNPFNKQGNSNANEGFDDIKYMIEKMG